MITYVKDKKLFTNLVKLVNGKEEIIFLSKKE